MMLYSDSASGNTMLKPSTGMAREKEELWNS